MHGKLANAAPLQRGTGKSFLLRNMLYAMRKIFPMGIVFSRTETANSFFGDFVPKEYIYDDVRKPFLLPLLTTCRYIPKSSLSTWSCAR